MSMTTATSENLASNTPERDGYEFIGWCLGTASSSNITTTDGVDTCSSTVYQPSASVAIASGASNDKYLYAMWQKATPAVKYMQDYTLATCQSEASSGNVTLVDSRDNSEYTVRYINGACWMTQNLRFTGTSLSTTTSNVSANRTISYGDLNSGNSFTEARIHNSGDTATGVWYNFCAAGAKESGACTDSSKYTSSYDICPKNWHLPTKSQFSGIISYKDDFSPVAGGSYSIGSLVDTGYGFWWSATASDASSQYSLRYDGSSLDTIDYYRGKGRGYYVRCVRSS